MSHLDISAQVKPSSDAPPTSPPKAAPPSPQFAESQQSSPPTGTDRPETPPSSANGSSAETPSPEKLSPEKLSLDATEPFPPGLFRVPVPNAVFSKMPSVSDSALRCLLALIRLSFRFDPAESEWVHTGDWFSRRDVEAECGLSSQGTRNGLDELESLGWTEVDRDGKRHWYQLALEAPARRFTYVPTALLEHADAIGSGTELRVVLAVLRHTWGWTCRETDPETEAQRVVHDRWARLSNRRLAEATGRSGTAVVQAASALQGEWLGRTRPGNGPYQYRFLPGATRDACGDSSGDRSGALDPSCGAAANDLAPDRQKSGTPTSNRESSSKDRHSRPEEEEHSGPTRTGGSERRRAVPPDDKPGEPPHGRRQEAKDERSGEAPPPDFSDLSPEKQELAGRLANVGVWAGRIAEVLSRFSTERIRANFELYRRRAAEQTIWRPGAWLYRAITDGYVLSDEDVGQGAGTRSDGSSPLSSPDHKEILSEARKDAYVARGYDEAQFHRCLSGGGDVGEPRFMLCKNG